MEIAPGLRVYLGSRLWQTNAYLLRTPDGSVLVDAPGWVTQRVLSDVGAPGGDGLKYILLTHCDFDHVGGLHEIKQATGARLVTHSAEAPVVEARADRPSRYPLGIRIPVIARPTRRHPVRVDSAAEDRDTVAGIQLLHTPGHTPGSACFWWPDRSALFVGDLFMNRGRLTKPFAATTPDPEACLCSAQRVAALEFEICCFGHGPPIVGGASRVIREFVAQR